MTRTKAPYKTLPDHHFHRLTVSELLYAARDAKAAADAVQGHDDRAESKYRDQVCDAGTVLYYRDQLQAYAELRS